LISEGRLGLAVTGLLDKPAAGAAGGFGVGSVAGFFDAARTNGIGMRGGNKGWPATGLGADDILIL